MVKKLTVASRLSLNNKNVLSSARRVYTVKYDEETFLEDLARKDNRVRRQQFLRRMEHKLNAKEHRFSR
jgi:hypothetical protein